MPKNDKKIMSIIHEECAGLEDRCEGYSDEIFDVINHILQHEREHRVSATHIQKKINDKCNAAAGFLVSKRGPSARLEGRD